MFKVVKLLLKMGTCLYSKRNGSQVLLKKYSQFTRKYLKFIAHKFMLQTQPVKLWNWKEMSLLYIKAHPPSPKDQQPPLTIDSKRKSIQVLLRKNAPEEITIWLLVLLIVCHYNLKFLLLFFFVSLYIFYKRIY